MTLQWLQDQCFRRSLTDIWAVIKDTTSYKSLIRGLQYLVLTRLEIAFAINKLSQ